VASPVLDNQSKPVATLTRFEFESNTPALSLDGSTVIRMEYRFDWNLDVLKERALEDVQVLDILVKKSLPLDYRGRFRRDEEYGRQYGRRTMASGNHPLAFLLTPVVLVNQFILGPEEAEPDITIELAYQFGETLRGRCQLLSKKCGSKKS
jgi:hypothetical protein